MSIASAITAAQGRVADAYTAVSNMGGTLPATQNLTNLPTAINSIPAGTDADVKDFISINKYGEDIYEGDKIWLQHKPCYEYNFIPVNNPIINDSNKTVFGFSGRRGITLDRTIDFSGTWEVQMKFTTGPDVSLRQKLNGSADNVDWDFPTVDISSTNNTYKFRMCLSSTGTSWDITNAAVGTYTILPKTTYWIKFGWTGSVYYLEYSTDGFNFVRDISFSSTTAVHNSTRYMCLGNDIYSANYEIPFYGTLDLSETYVATNGVVSWSPLFNYMSDFCVSPFYDLSNPNYTVNGTLTIEKGIASGFSTNNYIIPACMFDSAYDINTTWEWKVKFNIDTLGEFNAILGGPAGSYMLDLYVSVANKIAVSISSNGSSYDIANDVEGLNTLKASTDYWVKLGWNGKEYYVDLSENGIDFTREISIFNSSRIYSYSYSSLPLSIGFRVGCYFHGSIDLCNTSVMIKNDYATYYKKMYTWYPYNICVDKSFYITGMCTMDAEDGQNTEGKAIVPHNYNFAVVGNPNIDEETGELTGLTADDYIYIKDVPQNITSYEIVMKVKTPANNTALNERQYIIGSTEGHTPYIRTSYGQIESAHPTTSTSTTSTTRTKWQKSASDWAYDTDAWIKLTWNGTTFEMLRSLDGSTWTSCGTASATTLYWTNNLVIGFGGTNTVSGYLNTIYLKDCYININGKRWWNAFKAG